MADPGPSPRIAVLIPCYNEAAAIGTVIGDFRRVFPAARICVFDNNSSDGTAVRAQAAGAEVWHEPRQGKGHVVRRMFAEIDADVYLMVDGDATYDADSAPAMIETLLSQRLDMVVGRRVSEDQAAYRSGHRTGNRLLTSAVSFIFGQQMSDILSGYRAFSRRFVKSFPATAVGFETETELTVHALQLRLPVAEIDTPYFARPQGSASKLSTWSDGLRILVKILRLFSLEKPLRFFSLLALAFFLAATALFLPVLIEYFETGLVSRIPSLIVAVGGYLVTILWLMVGIILRTTSAGRLEARRLAYLALDPPPRA
jgi:glycosyltransferase involved in cell wall biosynthesis